MSLRQFITSKIFLKQVIIAVIISVVLIWVIFKFLSIYTRHGNSYPVPELIGLTMEEIEKETYKGDLEFVIIDSIHDDKKLKGSVIDQDPAPGVNVKHGRKIYLTTVAILPEQVNMPDLLDLTLRQAVAMLETYGLRPGRLEYVPDIADNAVLKQKYKGKPIEPGTEIEKGSRIDLVLGKGLNSEDGSNAVPDLIGKFRDEAVLLIGAASMNVGAEIFMDGKDTVNARVFKQNPSAGQQKSYGQPIDLWYRSNKKFDFSTILRDSVK